MTSKGMTEFRIGNALTMGSPQGFTLLELVLSIALTGIIAVIITGAMRISFDSVEKGEIKIGSLDRYRTSFSVVDAQIESQIPLTYQDEGETKYYFLGEEKSLRFSSNYSLWNAGRGYVFVTYTVEEDEAGKEMLRVSEIVIGSDDVREATLFRGLDSIYFEYFYKTAFQDEELPAAEQPEIPAIPEKIVLHLIEADNDFSLLIPVRTAPDQAVIVDR